MSLYYDLFFSGIFAYLIGAIPTGYIIARLFANIDITCHGSGNIGASNSARLLGKPCFFLVLLFDAGKAFGTYWLFSNWFTDSNFFFYAFVGACLLVGNAYSCFIGFKGGKGVATALGIVAYLFPFWIAVLFAAIWAIVFIVTRKAAWASMLSLTGAIIFIFTRLFVVYHVNERTLGLSAFILFLYFFVLFRHKKDIANLIAGKL